MKTLEDERYVVIKAYKCTVSEIWRDSYVCIYCVYVVSLHTESTDSVIVVLSIPLVRSGRHGVGVLAQTSATLKNLSVKIMF